MNEEPMPGPGSDDQPLIHRWRQQSVEEPSGATDDRIRAAARDALGASAAQASHRTRRSARWTRFAPLAAAASVALLAVGLVRLIPREEYQAVPRPELIRPRDAREPASSADPEAKSGPAYEGESDPRYMRGEAHPDALPDEPEHARERARAPELAARPESEREHTARSVIDREVSTAAAEDADASEQAPVEQPAVPGKAPARASGIGPAAQAAISQGTSARAGSATIAAISPELASRVQNDAARRTGLDAESIRIVAVDPVASSDGSPGCEVAGAPAPETRVPGYIVTVEASERTLRYHTDGRDRIAICEEE
jgi:hypothetical protein